MKKWWVGLLLAVTMLTGCGLMGGGEALDTADRFRKQTAEHSGSFRAGIVADVGDLQFSFSMDCSFDSKGTITFEITAPETIAGITGSITGAGGQLTFDDVALDFELLADGQVTPVSGPWILMKTLLSGYLTACAEEEELLHLNIDDSYEDDALHLDIWLNAENRPTQAEITYDGRRIVAMEITNFVIG